MKKSKHTLKQGREIVKRIEESEKALVIKRIPNGASVKLSSTLAGQRELLRQMKNKINEIIDYLVKPQEEEKEKKSIVMPHRETVKEKKAREKLIKSIIKDGKKRLKAFGIYL